MTLKCAWHISEFKVDIAERQTCFSVIALLVLIFDTNSNSRTFFALPDIYYNPRD